MSPRNRLTKMAVVQAAVDLINTEGADALSLNHLAEKLGIQTPSLYNHVDGLPGLQRELAVMKPSAVFINIARGTLVDEDALIRALQEKRLAGAAMDVFRSEPPPQDSPLWEMTNVIISPHSASTVRQENARIAELFCDNLRRYMSGRPLRNVLDAERLY